MAFSPDKLKARLPAGAQRWWVAFSGGLDSTVLLHALVSLGGSIPIRALHIHHGLSPQAGQWQAHCERICQTLGVPLEVVSLALDDRAPNLEERARQARYDAFARFAGEGDVLLMAHHRDDQAETVLLRLLRGSGPRGLAGMPPQRPLGTARLCRPLLAQTRAELETYARHHRLSWVDDESNRDTRFARNYLRNELMPRLSRRWPDANSKLESAARACRESADLLADLAQMDLVGCDECGDGWGRSLKREPLARLPQRRRTNALREWWRRWGGAVPAERRLVEMDRQFCRRPAGHGAEVRVGDTLIRAFDDRLYLVAQPWQPDPQQPPLDWLAPHTPIELPAGDSLHWCPDPGPRGLAPQWLERPMQIRWRRGGERCQPAGRPHSQTLKKLLHEYRLPTWQRSRVPLVYIDDELAAVGDLWVCEPFSTGEGQAGYRCRWRSAD